MRKIWNFLRTSLWFLPSLIVFAAVASALALLEIDSHYKDIGLADQWPRIFGASADGARAMLSVIATSVIGVAGVAFSITVVVLALASSQFSPRVLRNFMRDRRSQGVLGGFLGIYAYCLLVLRTVRHDSFIPSLAILGSIVLAFIGIGLLIFFIHHIASAIHATSIAREVYRETIEALELNFPDKFDRNREEAFYKKIQRSKKVENWYEVKSHKTGYIQGVDFQKLKKIAQKNTTLVKMEKAIGDFVVKRSRLLVVRDMPLKDLQADMQSVFSIGDLRTLDQDVAYGIRQLVDVSLKSLSPGINDTTTALICIDYLGAILAQAVRLQLDLSIQHGTNEDVCVLALGPDFEGLVSSSFEQIRQVGKGNPAVLLRILESVETILGQACEEVRIDILKRQVLLIQEVALAHIPIRDRSNIEKTIFRLLNNPQLDS